MNINPMKTNKVSELVCFYLTNGLRIVGSLHMSPNTRITETMNFHYSQKPFIPITDARIFDADGKVRLCSFIVINKNQIIMAFPVKKIPASPEAGKGDNLSASR